MGKNRDKILEKATSAKRESKHVDFKEQFDPNETGDWCEIIKDMVAMANSGGGIIILGVKNDGSPSRVNVSAILQTDPAKITDKIAKYTGEQFDEFNIKESYRDGCEVVVLEMGSATIPMIFTREGAYNDIRSGKQKLAFSKGSIYFRHSAKSEPGNSADLRKSLERELTRIRKWLLENIRKVISTPTGEVVESDLKNAQPINIVDDLSVPAYRHVWDETAYQSPQEIVIGALKSWKRDKSSCASESDMWYLYAKRNSLQLDEEKAECLLESAINRYAPFFFFAQLLSPQHLIDFVKRVTTGRYPAPNMAVKLAYAIGGKEGSELLDYIKNNCDYTSTQSSSSKKKETISRRNRLKNLSGITITIQNQITHVQDVKTSVLEELMASAISAMEKKAIKQLDILLYAPKLELEPKK